MSSIIDEIISPAAMALVRKPKRRKRACIDCGRLFLTPSPGLRRCTRCKPDHKGARNYVKKSDRMAK